MTIQDVFALLGAIFSFAILLAFLVVGTMVLKDWIETLKHRYRYKHRFDKPPTAECYCIDCTHHDRETGRCWRFGETTKEYRCTADNWFCWEAKPRKKEDA